MWPDIYFFQSTRRGGATDGLLRGDYNSNFNPRARGGRDLPSGCPGTGPRYFNPRARGGRDSIRITPKGINW